jgi:hypothetical protein
VYHTCFAVVGAGAGDAFFGGVVASLNAWGMPASADDLLRVGSVAASCGAACCEVIGALPVIGDRCACADALVRVAC